MGVTGRRRGGCVLGLLGPTCCGATLIPIRFGDTQAEMAAAAEEDEEEEEEEEEDVGASAFTPRGSNRTGSGSRNSWHDRQHHKKWHGQVVRVTAASDSPFSGRLGKVVALNTATLVVSVYDACGINRPF